MAEAIRAYPLEAFDVGTTPGPKILLRLQFGTSPEGLTLVEGLVNVGMTVEQAIELGQALSATVQAARMGHGPTEMRQ